MKYARKERRETALKSGAARLGRCTSIDSVRRNRLDTAMKIWATISAALVLAGGTAQAKTFGWEAPPPDEYRQLTEVRPLPVALDRDFQFRKIKTFLIDDTPAAKGVTRRVQTGRSGDPTIEFERAYRLYGAVTALDQRRRYGHYFDFFWRARQPGPLTVRLEYRQEKLRAFTQAREVSYASAQGSHRTSFAVVGDDFFNDGRVVSWRCLLLRNGRIVAEERSYLWR
jgi:hypothetical protein